MTRARFRRRGPAFVVGAAFAFCILCSGAAQAYVPPIDGHLTDPGHRLKSTEKDSLEDTMGKIQTDTQVDCAGWVMNEPTNEPTDLGREAYDHWRIGRDWENGVLFIFPLSGPALLIQNPDRPALTPSEVSRVLGVDVPGNPQLSKRIERDVNEVGAVLRVGSKAPKARPPGAADPKRGALYAAATGAVVLAAIALTFRRRRLRTS